MHDVEGSVMSETPDAPTPQVLRPRMRTLGKIMAWLSPVVFLVGIIGAGFGWHELIVDGTRMVGIFALSTGLLLITLSDPARDRTSETAGSDGRAMNDEQSMT